MRYKITVQYWGANYCGWQSQKNGVSIQDKLEEALSQLFCQKIKTVGSGRTDEGVNALGQVAHFDADKEIKPFNLCRGVNVFLPKDISVVQACLVDSDFNARKSAKRKTYVYKMYVSSFRRPLYDIDHKQIFKQPDIEAMKKAASYLIGKHDFACFMSTGSNAKTTVREIYACEISTVGDEICIYVTGNAFLYNMVRAIAGTLLSVGSGKIKPETMQDILEGKSRRKAGKTLSPNGLTLVSVEY